MKFSGSTRKKQETVLGVRSPALSSQFSAIAEVHRSLGLLSGNDNPYRAAARAVAAALLAHQRSRSAAFQATGDNVQFLQ